jgi:glycine/D-amino acid oxidase-like deaminating enzyme
MMQPAALVRGLAAALPHSVDLFEASPVRRIAPGTPLRLEAGDGSLTADRLFLATNGYTSSLGLVAHRVLPMLTFASLTRVLTAAEQTTLGGDAEWGLVSEEPIGSSVRRTRDQRLLIRNSVRYAVNLWTSDATRRAVRAQHRDGLRARFPLLADLDIAYTWGGVMGISINGGQHFGRVGDNIFASAGYNGVGVAMGTIAGTLLADLALGERSAQLSDIESLPRPIWIPRVPGLGVAVRATLAFMTARARGEL